MKIIGPSSAGKTQFRSMGELVEHINRLFPLASKQALKRKHGHDQADKPFIEIGAQIICPNRYCRRPIATFIKNLYPNSVIKAEYLHGPGIRPGAEMKCVSCNMPWYLAQTGQIHLRSGWHPKY